MRVFVGILLWLTLLVTGVAWSRNQQIASASGKVWQSLARSEQTFPLVGDMADLGGRIPVFSSSSKAAQLVGMVPFTGGETEPRILIFGDAEPFDPAHFQLRLQHGPMSLGDAVTMLLPPQKKAALAREWKNLLAENQTKFVEIIRPVAQSAIDEILPVFETELSSAVSAEWPKLNQSLEAVFRGPAGSHAQEVLREVVWPILKERASPKADEIAKELWNRVSLWRFGVRAALDATPIGGSLVEKEWTRFVNNEALPILQKHTGELASIAMDVLKDSASDAKLRGAINSAFSQMLADPNVQASVHRIFKTAVMESPAMKSAVLHVWNRPEVQKSIAELGRILEPAIQRTGDLIISDGKGGFSPEFLAVIRNQGLGKDKYWFTLEDRSTDQPAPKPGALFVVRSNQASVYPTLIPPRDVQ